MKSLFGDLRISFSFTRYCPAMPFGNRKKILQKIFAVQYCHNLKKYHPSGNLKFINSGTSQSLKFPILMETTLPISLKLNFTLNTLGCYGLSISIRHPNPFHCIKFTIHFITARKINPILNA